MNFPLPMLAKGSALDKQVEVGLYGRSTSALHEKSRKMHPFPPPTPRSKGGFHYCDYHFRPKNIFIASRTAEALKPMRKSIDHFMSRPYLSRGLNPSATKCLLRKHKHYKIA